MAQVIKLKRSSVAGKTPTASDLQLGEIAVNTRAVSYTHLTLPTKA